MAVDRSPRPERLRGPLRGPVWSSDKSWCGRTRRNHLCLFSLRILFLNTSYCDHHSDTRVNKVYASLMNRYRSRSQLESSIKRGKCSERMLASLSKGSENIGASCASDANACNTWLATDAEKVLKRERDVVVRVTPRFEREATRHDARSLVCGGRVEGGQDMWALRTQTK